MRSPTPSAAFLRSSRAEVMDQAGQASASREDPDPIDLRLVPPRRLLRPERRSVCSGVIPAHWAQLSGMADRGTTDSAYKTAYQDCMKQRGF